MNPKQVIGRYFEGYVMVLFDLVKTEKKEFPDLVSKDDLLGRLLYVEVKSSKEGGVIKEAQLKRFGGIADARRSYALCYHTLTDIEETYPTEGGLIYALNQCKKQVYLFPFSIVKAHFEAGKKQIYAGMDRFVHFRQNQARDIFNKDAGMWDKLGLDMSDYTTESDVPYIYIIKRKPTDVVQALV
ncbi:MAG: hypothetical protein PHC66_03255 [Candidatus Nanoarchaeia archaeon]|nr:hypothetical protein [Candidatus Nanoarchaeia archaeon]MDD5239862.1 hypothetical protein [Candidatus Nanoarchaeia archaeon]